MLVGVSHECDYPPEVVADLPRLTRSAIPPGPSSAEVDAAVVARLHAGQSLYLLEDRLLAELKPDLLITQELCDVCAVSSATPPPSASRGTCASERAGRKSMKS
jgi:iron complex transport system substrate-binding protein